MNTDSQFEDQMVHFLDGRICLVGVGNRYWRDDGVGSVLAKPWKPARTLTP